MLARYRFQKPEASTPGCKVGHPGSLAALLCPITLGSAIPHPQAIPSRAHPWRLYTLQCISWISPHTNHLTHEAYHLYRSVCGVKEPHTMTPIPGVTVHTFMYMYMMMCRSNMEQQCRTPTTPTIATPFSTFLMKTTSHHPGSFLGISLQRLSAS